MSNGAAPSTPSTGLGFLTRGDAIDIAGHKIPVSVLAVVATLLAAFLVLRARSKGSQLAAVGTPASTPSAVDASGTTTGFASGYDPNAAAIADLQQGQTALASTLAQMQATPTPATSSAPAGSVPTPVIGPDKVSFHIDPSGALLATYSAGGKLITDWWGTGFDPSTEPQITDLGNGVYHVAAQMSNGDVDTFTKGLPGGIAQEITGTTPVPVASTLHFTSQSPSRGSINTTGTIDTVKAVDNALAKAA